MRRLLFSLIGLLVFFCIFAPATFAQVEISGAYSFLRTGSTAGGPGLNLNGWDASASVHLLEGLGLEADYSDEYGNLKERPGFTQLYGPRYELLNFPRVEPYVHALFGTVNEGERNICSGPFSQDCVSSKQTDFGMAFGGGLEVKFTRHIWIRPFQLDYIRFKFGDYTDYAGRFSAGIVFRFGKW